MRTTIVIPNYNGMAYLKNCLESLVSECRQGEDEILIVDNDSKDGSIAFLSEHYPQLEVIRMASNAGFAKAVNVGIQASRSQYVVLLNNDTEVAPGWLDALVEAAGSSPEVFSVSSKMLRYDDRSLIDDAGDELTLAGWAYKRGDGKPRSRYGRMEEVFSACAGAAIYRREVFDKIGFFDESFFAYLEDVDIGYRARLHGYKNMYAPKAIVYHIGSATSGGGKNGLNAFKVSLSARNNVKMLMKNMPTYQLVLNSPFLFAGFAWKYVSYVRAGFGKEFLQGTREGWELSRSAEKSAAFRKSAIAKIEFQLLRSLIRYYMRRFL